MILSDRSIREALESGRIKLDPVAEDAVQPSSVDVRLDRAFRVFANHRYPHIDVRLEQPDLTELIEVEWDEAFVLHPGEFVLASTLEVISLGDQLAGRLEGKSSLGRLGLGVGDRPTYLPGARWARLGACFAPGVAHPREEPRREGAVRRPDQCHEGRPPADQAGAAESGVFHAGDRQGARASLRLGSRASAFAKASQASWVCFCF
jgi:hypothetical protein